MHSSKTSFGTVSVIGLLNSDRTVGLLVIVLTPITPMFRSLNEYGFRPI